MLLSEVRGRLLFINYYERDGTPTAPPTINTLTPAFSSKTDLQKAEKEMLQLLLQAEDRSTSGAAGCSLVFGFILLFVPVIGWLIGPVFILKGIIGLLVPSIAFKILFGQDYARIKALAHTAVRNAYLNVSCPACAASWTPAGSAFYFLKNPEGVDCGSVKRGL